jgi:hypothetical protein
VAVPCDPSHLIRTDPAIDTGQTRIAILVGGLKLHLHVNVAVAGDRIAFIKSRGDERGVDAPTRDQLLARVDFGAAARASEIAKPSAKRAAIGFTGTGRRVTTKLLINLPIVRLPCDLSVGGAGPNQSCRGWQAKHERRCSKQVLQKVHRSFLLRAKTPSALAQRNINLNTTSFLPVPPTMRPIRRVIRRIVERCARGHALQLLLNDRKSPQFVIPLL